MLREGLQLAHGAVSPFNLLPLGHYVIGCATDYMLMRLRMVYGLPAGAMSERSRGLR